MRQCATRGLFNSSSALGSGGVGPRIGSLLFHWPRPFNPRIERGISRQHYPIRVQSMQNSKRSEGSYRPKPGPP
eukprot:249298-Chlamydomonas_euryale.AAC.4